jgi:hypothetical protein
MMVVSREAGPEIIKYDLLDPIPLSNCSLIP